MRRADDFPLRIAKELDCASTVSEMRLCIDKARSLGAPVAAIEVYWNDDHMCWLATVAAIVRRPSFAHPELEAHDLIELDPNRGPALARARAIGEATADALGVPFCCTAGPDMRDKQDRWLARQTISEREYTVRWRASALHCVHDDAELPIERAGDLVVLATRPALALREAKRHALAQLPSGDDWRREAQVALTIDGVDLGWGHATRARGGDRPL